MILDLHRQGVSVSDIARRIGLDRKTVHVRRGKPSHREPRSQYPDAAGPTDRLFYMTLLRAVGAVFSPGSRLRRP